MSKLATKIKKFYDDGIYSYAQVEQFYKKGKITEAEFKEITEANESAESV